jgi:uncharacterized UBP type Zn finger protein
LEGFQVVKTLFELATKLNDNHQRKTAFNPIRLLHLLPLQFNDRTIEHDTHEVLCFLKSELDSWRKSVYQPCFPFQGTLTKTSTCSSGHSKPNREEPFEEIGISIPYFTESSTSAPAQLQDLFFSSLKSTNEAKCESCNSAHNVYINEITSISSAPSVLFLHLLRFKICAASQQIQKNMSPVHCNRNIQTTLFGSNEILNYTYRASISHVGTSTTEGHYVFYKTAQNGKFYKINDAVVSEFKSEVEFESLALYGGGVESETPYVLLYERTI